MCQTQQSDTLIWEGLAIRGEGQSHQKKEVIKIIKKKSSNSKKYLIINVSFPLSLFLKPRNYLVGFFCSFDSATGTIGLSRQPARVRVKPVAQRLPAFNMWNMTRRMCTGSKPSIADNKLCCCHRDGCDRIQSLNPTTSQSPPSVASEPSPARMSVPRTL